MFPHVNLQFFLDSEPTTALLKLASKFVRVFQLKKIIKTDLQLENIETIVELKSNIKRTSNCCDYQLFRFTMGGVWIKKGASRRFSKSGTQNLLMVYQLWTSAKNPIWKSLTTFALDFSFYYYESPYKQGQ